MRSRQRLPARTSLAAAAACKWWSKSDLQLHFWRTRAGNEVDFVLYGGEGFFAIEVKAGERVRREDLRGLRAFGEDYPEAQRLLLYRGRDELLIDGVRCAPVDTFLRQVHPRRALPFLS